MAGKKTGRNKKGAKDEDDKITLIEGSEYKVQSLGSRDTPIQSSGVFRGYTMLGNHAEAICLELGEGHRKLAGKIRVIPTHMVLSIDIIKEGEKGKEEEEDSASRSYM